MEEEKKKGTSVANAVGVAVFAILIGLLVLALMPGGQPADLPLIGRFFTRQPSIYANENAAAANLKTLCMAMVTFKKKEYACRGRSYPVGNDPEVKNSGKLCGLFYEVDNDGNTIALIRAELAQADFRSGGSADPRIGGYVPCRLAGDIVENLSPAVFTKAPNSGYWFALMEYYHDGEQRVPYDKEHAKHSFGIVAFPAEYGRTGENTYIINEEGTVYARDLKTGAYIDTYPGPDPTGLGWVIAE